MVYGTRQNIIVTAILTASLLFSVSAVFASTDEKPPYLVNPIPEPGSFDNPLMCWVKVGIVDDISGVDDSQLTMEINGGPPKVQPIIEQSYKGKGVNIYFYLEALNPGEKITIAIHCSDYEQNWLDDSWHFFVGETSYRERCVPMYPRDASYLLYDKEFGSAQFTWTQGHQTGYYRIRFDVAGSGGWMDIGPDEFITNFGLVSIALPLTLSDWLKLSSLGEISWQVAPIDQPNGTIMDHFSKTQRVIYKGESLSVLEYPEHKAELKSQIPPEFKWSTGDDISETLLIFVQLDRQGNYTNVSKVYELPWFINAIPFTPSIWDEFPEGQWAWTVIGMRADGSVTDYMINQFWKRSSGGLE